MVLLCLTLLIICSYTDIKEHGISLKLIGVFSVFFVILMVGALVLGDRFGILKRSLVYEPGIINILSGLIPGLILLVICRISKEAVGKGDVYVVLLLGLMLGFEKTFTILFLSMTMTAVFGLGCLAVGNRKKKDSLPFIPFVLGAFAVLMITGRTVV